MNFSSSHAPPALLILPPGITSQVNLHSVSCFSFCFGGIQTKIDLPTLPIPHLHQTPLLSSHREKKNKNKKTPHLIYWFLIFFQRSMIFATKERTFLQLLQNITHPHFKGQYLQPDLKNSTENHCKNNNNNQGLLPVKRVGDNIKKT